MLTYRIVRSLHEQNADKSKSDNRQWFTRHFIKLGQERCLNIMWIFDQRYSGNNALRKNKRSDTQIHLRRRKRHKNPMSALRHKYKRTSETPYVSHFTSDLGKTGKSTARIASTVMSIICVLYVVKAGNGANVELPTTTLLDVLWYSCWLNSNAEGVFGWDEGRGVPSSCFCNRRRSSVGRSKKVAR